MSMANDKGVSGVYAFFLQPGYREPAYKTTMGL